MTPAACPCGSQRPIVATDPGDAPEHTDAGHILVNRGRPMRFMCLACWPALRGFQQDLFREART